MNYEKIILSEQGFFSQSSLIKIFGGTPYLWKKSLIKLKKEKKIKPYYRLINTYRYLNYENDWKQSIGELSKIFQTREYREIDGSDTDNIEIGFKVIS